MRAFFFRVVSIVLLTLFAEIAFFSTAHAEPPALNGIYLMTVPSEYDVFENAIKNYRDSGANAIIVNPVSGTGGIDRQTIAKAVFFAHGSGLKLFVVLPTRDLKNILKIHPEWEDDSYDLRSGTLEKNGKVDLFNPYVVVYFSDLVRDIAGFAVDGVLLDDDFFYGDTEGLSGAALKRFQQKYGTSFIPRKALAKFSEGNPIHSPELYGEDFWNMAELKKNVLVLLLKNMMESSRSVNKDFKFGISLHVPGLFLQKKELLAWYAHDLDAFAKANTDFFWLTIPHRVLQEQQDLNYKKSLEAVSRKVVSTGTLVKEPAKIIIAVQAASSGRALSLTEIEEVSMQIKKAGDPGLAFMVEPDTQLPAAFTKKMFRHLD